MLFDNRTVYLGASRDKYEQYCKALDSEKIKYKTKRVNHEEKMIAPDRGTARSMGGNFGTDKTLYEIMVGEKDYDNAMGILTALKYTESILKKKVCKKVCKIMCKITEILEMFLWENINRT